MLLERHNCVNTAVYVHVYKILYIIIRMKIIKFYFHQIYIAPKFKIIQALTDNLYAN